MVVALRNAVVRAALPASRFLAERIVLGRFRVCRVWARRILAAQVSVVEPLVAPDFYLRQFATNRARIYAARDPILHYILIGRFRTYSPNPDFDPVFYRADNPDLSWWANPLCHYARRRSRKDLVSAEFAAGERAFADGPTGGVAVTLNHGRGGGSHRFLRIYETALEAQGFRILRLARLPGPEPLFRAIGNARLTPDDPIFNLCNDEEAMVRFLREVGATKLVVNHLIDLPFSAFERLPRLAARAGVEFEMLLHDYYLICPRIDLVDRSERYCGEPPVAQCRSCLRHRKEQVDPAEWRFAAHALLRAASRVVVPSEDTMRRFARYWPDIAITVWHAENDATIEPASPFTIGAADHLRILVLGNLNIPKGFNVVRRLARRIRRRKLPLRLILFGSSLDDAGLAKLGVSAFGRYRESEIDILIRRHSPHVALMPAIWPETWSFTLSVVLRHRIPVTAFDIGAIADRLRNLGDVLPLAIADDPDRLADHFLALRHRAIARRVV